MIEIFLGVAMFTAVVLTLVAVILMAKWKLVAAGYIAININCILFSANIIRKYFLQFVCNHSIIPCICVLPIKIISF